MACSATLGRELLLFTTSSSSSSYSWCNTQRVSFRVQQHNRTLTNSLRVERNTILGLSVAQCKASSTTSSTEWKSKPLPRNVFNASKKIKSIIMLNVIAVVYASEIMVIKEAEISIDPAAFSAVRFAISAIPFLPFVFEARDDFEIRNAGFELGFWLSLAYFTEAIALLTSEASRASFISLVTVISVPLLDGMLGAIIPLRTRLGILVSAIGFAVLECGGSSPNIGDLLNFLSAIFFGIHILRSEHFSCSTKKESLLALIGFQAIGVAVLSTLWVVLGGCFDGQRHLSRSTWAWTELWDWIVAFPWIPALYTGIFSSGICSAIEFGAMREVSATEAAIIYGLEPVWGAGFAWFLLGERWGTLGWIGATLIFGGSLMVQMFGSSETEKPLDNNKICHIPEEQMIKHALSASPITVRSREKGVQDIFN